MTLRTGLWAPPPPMPLVSAGMAMLPIPPPCSALTACSAAWARCREITEELLSMGEEMIQ